MTYKTKDRQEKINEIAGNHVEAEHVLNLLDFAYDDIARLKKQLALAEAQRIQPEENYLLIDLERSILGQGVTYWKPSGRGYTRDKALAGRYPGDVARVHILEDMDGRTVAFSESNLDRLLKK